MNGTTNPIALSSDPSEAQPIYDPTWQDTFHSSQGSLPSDPMDLSFEGSSQPIDANDQTVAYQGLPPSDALPDDSRTWSSTEKFVHVLGQEGFYQFFIDRYELGDLKVPGTDYSVVPHGQRELIKHIDAEGWCLITDRPGTKAGGEGYVQGSWPAQGIRSQPDYQPAINNAFLLHKASAFLYERGNTPGPLDNASHLCHQDKCVRIGHIVHENAVYNERRKRCVIWMQCHHCSKVIVVCQHQPKCIPTDPEALLPGDCETLRMVVRVIYSNAGVSWTDVFDIELQQWRFDVLAQYFCNFDAQTWGRVLPESD